MFDNKSEESSELIVEDIENIMDEGQSEVQDEKKSEDLDNILGTQEIESIISET